MNDKEIRKMLRACRAAHRTLWKNRDAVIQGHSTPAGRLLRRSITDPFVLQWLEEHDQAIWALRESIKAARASLDLNPAASRTRARFAGGAA